MTAPQGVSKSLFLNFLLVIPIKLKMNMQHFMGMAFWVFIWSVTLSDTHPIDKNYLPDFKIEYMRNHVKCVSNFLSISLDIFCSVLKTDNKMLCFLLSPQEEDSLFYTPKPTEVRQYSVLQNQEYKINSLK